MGLIHSFQDYDRESIGTERIQPATNGGWNRPYGRQKPWNKLWKSIKYSRHLFNRTGIKHHHLQELILQISKAKIIPSDFTTPTSGATVTILIIVNIFDPNFI